MEAKIEYQSMTDSYSFTYQSIKGTLRKLRKFVNNHLTYVAIFVEADCELTKDLAKSLMNEVYYPDCKIYHQFKSGEVCYLSDVTRFFKELKEEVENA